MNKSSATRMSWVDLIKGTSVVLVVLMHSALVLEATNSDGIRLWDSSAVGLWNDIGALLEPLRMPIFFLVSGILAAGAIQRSWGQNRRRTWGMAYLYALWTVLLLILTTAFLSQTPWEAVTSLPGQLLFASSGYWYLYALVLFFVVARLTRRVPALVVVAVATLINIARPITDSLLSDWLNPIHTGSLAPMIAMNLVFFLIGARYRDLVTRLANLANWPTVTLLSAALLAAGIYRIENPELLRLTFLPLSLGSIVWGLMIATLVTKNEDIRDLGSYMGKRTLPIYVMQFPLLFLVQWTLLQWQPGFMQIAWIQTLFPVLLTIGIVTISLLVYRWTATSSLSWLFTAPDWALYPTSQLRSVTQRRPAPPHDGAKVTSGSDHPVALDVRVKVEQLHRVG